MSSYFVRISLGDFHTNHVALTLWGCNYKFAPFIWADIFLSYFGANVLRVCIYKFAYRWLYNKVILLIITVQIYQGENLAKILIPAHLKLTEILTDLLELPSRWSTWLFGLPKIGWKAQQSPRSVFWTIPSIKNPELSTNSIGALNFCLKIITNSVK